MLSWLGLLVVVLIILGIGSTLPPTAAFGATALALLIVVPLSAVGIWLRLARTERAVEDFDGIPMPGILGLAGLDIDEDDDPDALSARQFVQQVDRAENPGARGRASPDAAAPHPDSSTGKKCPECGAITPGTSSKYCRVCGSVLS
ncbi:MAG: hypothetical protein L3K13_01955 [Thermoplasmata archaeon]|nr:hypothetical protein [Thermoplasmata archaeon]